MAYLIKKIRQSNKIKSLLKTFLISQIDAEVGRLKTTEGIKMISLRCRPEFLSKLAERHLLALRTNADRSSTIKFLKQQHIYHFWKKIITSEDLFGRNKIKTLRYFKQYFHQPMVYVGDMRSDIKAAQVVKARSVAICGFETAKMLRSAKPDFLIRRLNQLPKILRGTVSLKKTISGIDIKN